MTARTITLARSESIAPHSTDGPYVADVWAAVIGSTASMLIRRAHQLWAVHGDPCTIPAGDLAAWLGLPMPSRMVEACKRLDRFRLGSWDPDTQTLRIRSHVGELSPAQLERVGSVPRRIHGALTASAVAG